MAKAKLRFTENEVARAVRAVAKTGVKVARVIVGADGDIVVVAGTQPSKKPTEIARCSHASGAA